MNICLVFSALTSTLLLFVPPSVSQTSNVGHMPMSSVQFTLSWFPWTVLSAFSKQRWKVPAMKTSFGYRNFFPRWVLVAGEWSCPPASVLKSRYRMSLTARPPSTCLQFCLYLSHAVLNMKCIVQSDFSVGSVKHVSCNATNSTYNTTQRDLHTNFIVTDIASPIDTFSTTDFTSTNGYSNPDRPYLVYGR